MFFSAWIILVVVSLWVSLIAFLWALRAGQFSDQARARFLPLIDEAAPPPHAVKDPSKLTIEAYALMAIAALGVAGMLASIFLSFYRIR
jgi:cbb3-type cytochrome oxidase maturation protein